MDHIAIGLHAVPIRVLAAQQPAGGLLRLNADRQECKRA
jgi:hypothetical protein